VTVPAYEAIRNLLGTYCEVMDAGDFDGLGAMFADAKITDPKGRAIAQGAADIAALWKAMVRLYDGSPRTRHLVTGPVIEVTGETATCRSSFAVLQTFVDGSLHPVAAGRYRDTFGVTEGRWHFTERQFFLEQEGDMSQHMRDL
jgi:ketosteroid isomerase-like protein